MRITIVGGGKPLYYLSRKFLEKGHQVVIINRNLEECHEISRLLKVPVIHGDASDPVILEQADSHRADALIAITGKDQNNLAVCQLAKIKYEIPRTLALVNDPDNESVFQQLGVKAFSTTHFIASMLEQRTGMDEITNLIPVGEGKVNITEIKLPDDSPVTGKPLRDISFPEQSLVAIVIRDDQALVPRGDTVLKTGDKIVLITLPENHGKALKAVSGGKY
jgi:trk system potassium uptake protein TrkA